MGRCSYLLQWKESPPTFGSGFLQRPNGPPPRFAAEMITAKLLTSKTQLAAGARSTSALIKVTLFRSGFFQRLQNLAAELFPACKVSQSKKSAADLTSRIVPRLQHLAVEKTPVHGNSLRTRLHAPTHTRLNFLRHLDPTSDPINRLAKSLGFGGQVCIVVAFAVYYRLFFKRLRELKRRSDDGPSELRVFV